MSGACAALRLDDLVRRVVPYANELKGLTICRRDPRRVVADGSAGTPASAAARVAASTTAVRTLRASLVEREIAP